jgi:hypothetical protein
MFAVLQTVSIADFSILFIHGLKQRRSGSGVRMWWSKKRAIHATALRAGWSVVYNLATGAVIL